MGERRKYPRFELKVNAKHKIMSSSEVFKLGKTRNISAEGICFDSDKELDVGAYVSLEVDLQDKMQPITLVGEIRWSQPSRERSKKGRFINGVKLVKIPESDEGRFLKYYCDRMVQKLADYLKM